MSTATTVYVVYIADPDTGEAFYECETIYKHMAQAEVDRINNNMGKRGLPCTAFYRP